MPFLLYLAAYHVTPFDADWHLDVSLNRLLSHFIPLWVYAVAVFLFENRGRSPLERTDCSPL